MKTARDNHLELLQNLEAESFFANRWDTADIRQMDIKNADGYVSLRVKIDYQGEALPERVSLVKFAGDRSQLIKWESENMSARMPLDGILALIRSAI